mmetsp:Transcript_1529/g.6016  ORF Transcript_1529/g.6016 Transcript_1529/m.6016 type:complete len:237 (+) Transcript_1529:3882-4592(+)
MSSLKVAKRSTSPRGPLMVEMRMLTMRARATTSAGSAFGSVTFIGTVGDERSITADIWPWMSSTPSRHATMLSKPSSAVSCSSSSVGESTSAPSRTSSATSKSVLARVTSSAPASSPLPVCSSGAQSYALKKSRYACADLSTTVCTWSAIIRLTLLMKRTKRVRSNSVRPSPPASSMPRGSAYSLPPMSSMDVATLNTQSLRSCSATSAAWRRCREPNSATVVGNGTSRSSVSTRR